METEITVCDLRKMVLFFAALAFALGGCAAADQNLAAFGNQNQPSPADTPGAETRVTNSGDTITLVNPSVGVTSEPSAPLTSVVTPGPEPGEAGASAPVNASPIPTVLGVQEMSNWQLHTDPRYRYSISYDPRLSVRQLNASELAALDPVPLGAINFEQGSSSVPGIAPLVISVKIFQNSKNEPLDEWLRTTGLLQDQGSQVIEQYRGRFVTGIKVISLNFMAPGWSVLIARSDLVFQLTPIGEEGEAMLDTFRFLD